MNISEMLRVERQRLSPGKESTVKGIEDVAANAMFVIESAKSVLDDIVRINKYNKTGI